MKIINRNSSAVLIIISIIVASLIVSSFGCAKKEEKEIKIGTISPLTGAAASYGEKMTRAIDLAVQEVNEKGGINGKKVVVIHEDDKLEAKDGVTVFKKLTSIDKVSAVIGAVGSSVTLAIAPVAESSKIPLITPISSAVSISKAGDFIFRICPSDALQGVIISKWVKEKGFNNVAILYINNDYGTGLKDRFKEEFTKLGGGVVLEEAFEKESKDMRTQISKIKTAKVDAIFLPSYMEEAGTALKQIKELKVQAQVFGTDPYHDPKMLEIAGNAADGVLFTDVASPSGSVFEEFAKRYKAKYNQDAEVIAAQSYDAVSVLLKAIEKAGTDPVKIKIELYKVKFTGASGQIEFDQNGDVNTKDFNKFTVKKKAYVKVE